jgi:hypothetical protein
MGELTTELAFCLKFCGQSLIGPSDVFDQSKPRTSSPVSPPPIGHTGAARRLVIQYHHKKETKFSVVQNGINVQENRNFCLLFTAFQKRDRQDWGIRTPQISQKHPTSVMID